MKNPIKYCTHGVECFHCQLEREILELAKKLPSTDAGIEALDLAQRAISNVTNPDFKCRTRDYLNNFLIKHQRGNV